MDVVIIVSLIVVGLVVGTYQEKRHYSSIKERENANVYTPCVTFEQDFSENEISSSRLALGSAVISLDYFKRFIAALRNIVGGNVTTYESLIDRARREAILRMRESAPNADLIVNVRVETSTIGSSVGQNSIGSVEALAYGTAVKLIKQ